MPVAAIVSDMHSGHPGAIWPDNFETEDGNLILPNKFQKVMLQYWDDFMSRVNRSGAEYAINMEESIEGYSPKEHGQHIMTSDLNIQMAASLVLLNQFKGDRQYMAVRGSKYHGSGDVDVAKVMTAKLGGHYWGDIGMWQPKGTSRLVMLTHKPGDPMIYKSTVLDRNSLYMSAIKSKIKADPDLIVYGHLHQYFRFDTISRINFICPCWKFWHPIKSAAKYMYTQPVIGGVIVKIPRSSKKRIEVDPIPYPLQHLCDAVAEV